MSTIRDRTLKRDVDDNDHDNGDDVIMSCSNYMHDLDIPHAISSAFATSSIEMCSDYPHVEILVYEDCVDASISMEVPVWVSSFQEIKTYCIRVASSE